MKIPGMTDSLAEALCENGFCSLKDVASAEISNLCSASELSEQDAMILKKRASEALHLPRSFSKESDLKKSADRLNDVDGNNADSSDDSVDSFDDSADSSDDDSTDSSDDKPDII